MKWILLTMIFLSISCGDNKKIKKEEEKSCTYECEGDSICDIETNICKKSIFNNGSLGGACKNTKDSKESCDEGLKCNTAHNICEDMCKDVECSNHGVCELINNEYMFEDNGIYYLKTRKTASCNCNDGFHQTYDKKCIENEICRTNSCTKENKNTCNVENNEVTCSCNEGYHNNGFSYQPCVKDMVCEDSFCENGKCINSSYNEKEIYCICNEGYHADGTNCVLDEVCTSNSCTKESQNICEVEDGTINCQCSKGYHESYYRSNICVLDEVCKTDSCTQEHKTVCSIVDGKVSCGCDEGYHGYICTIDEVCNENSCPLENKTVCSIVDGKVSCSCNNPNEYDNFDNGCFLKPVIKQVGSSEIDKGISLVVDQNDNTYVLGYTNGNFDGNENVGSYDITLTKFNKLNEKQWSKQWGTNRNDRGLSITLKDNFLYITGETYGTLLDVQFGNSDGYISKINFDGDIIWIKQFGTSKSDISYSITTDENNIYVTGWSENIESEIKENIFIAKFNINTGEEIWFKEYNSDKNENGYSIKIYNENIYIVGVVMDNSYNALFMKLNKDGDLLLKKSYNYSYFIDLTINNNNIYISGSSLSKMNLNGEIIWERRDFYGQSNSIVFDDNYIYYIYGSNDIELVKVDLNGNKIWKKFWDSENHDVAISLVVNNQNNIIITGYTKGNLGSQNLGEEDLFLLNLKQ